MRGSLWDLRELPASSALCALRLWGAMLDCEDIREGRGGPAGLGPCEQRHKVLGGAPLVWGGRLRSLDFRATS